MDLKAPPGVFDILPQAKELWKSSYLWVWIENVMRELARDYCLQEIRTPIFERTELFCRTVGETSDIVTKEMYSFKDRGDRDITLRPEGTAPAIRAFLENQIEEERLFYIGPMFRYERSQAGRYRQHHQIGVELIGSSSPETDAELIDAAYSLYTRLGLQNLSISINSIGNQECRAAYKNKLITYLNEHLHELSQDSRNRLEKNPLRILDSKDPGDQRVVTGAPLILDFLDPISKEHFERTIDCLKALGIPFQINPFLVRGLDYYNQTVFEVVSTNLGAQNSVGGGGRYDGLIKELKGPDLPACGFGTGIERILQALIAQNAHLPAQEKPLLFLIPLSSEAKTFCFTLQKQLREARLPVLFDSSGKKLNKAMHLANKSQAAFVAVVGDDELTSRTLSLKEMSTGLSEKIPFESLATILKEKKSHV